MKITNLRINGIENPIGFAYDYVVCSWNVEDAKGKKQTNAIIEVSETEDFEAILYQKKSSDLQQHGETLEIELKPRTTYFYRVTVETDAGECQTSDTALFETGKRNETWIGKWISPAKEDSFHPILEKTFVLDKKVQRARLYLTGVGMFEVYLNGTKVGKEYLAPYLNQYETGIQVLTYPMDEMLRDTKEYTLEVMLGKGWYMGEFGLDLTEHNYGSRMAAIGELHLEYEDGTSEILATDESWKYYGSDIEDSGIYFGEIINRELWSEKENMKKPVEVLEHPETAEETKYLSVDHLMDRLSLPVVEKEQIAVQEIIYTPAEEIVLDMGQNFAGFVEFRANFPKGTKVVIDFGEILQQGNFYNKNYRDAKSQFVYISDGREEIVRPHFTFFGFRYVRVTGWPGILNKEDFVGKVIYSDIRRTGMIETANSKLNRLYENTVWGLKSNFIDMPTDCPQRSERLGWTGDAQVFAPTASYHMDTRAFFHKFVKDLRDEQMMLNGGMPNFLPNFGHANKAGSVWGDIATFLPDTLYTYFGNEAEMQYCYPLMKDWVDSIDREDALQGKFLDTFGDWLALDGATPTSFKGSTNDTYISLVYYYRSAQIVRQMAERLQKTEDALYYGQLEEQIKQTVLDEFYTPTGRLAIDTQAAYVIALKFNLYRDREKVIEQFKARLKRDMYQIKCGFVGAPLLCTVLAEAGEYELAYDFLLKEGFPSWLYSVDLGATTIWERWNSVMPDGTISDTGMNSLNHYAYGSVMEFVYAYVAGIRPLSPGFTKAMIAPHPDARIPAVSCSYASASGYYVCNWEMKEDGTFVVHIEIPFNCEAQVELPGYEKGQMTLEAGSYDFAYQPREDMRRPYGRHTTLTRIAKDGQAMEILGKYAPALAGIAASGDPEMGANSLEELLHMSFLPFDPAALEIAIEEICNVVVEIK